MAYPRKPKETPEEKAARKARLKEYYADQAVAAGIALTPLKGGRRIIQDHLGYREIRNGKGELVYKRRPILKADDDPFNHISSNTNKE